MVNNKLLRITIAPQSKSIILEQTEKYMHLRRNFCHIVSLNPENIIIAQHNGVFRKVIETAQIKIIDGIGIVLAAQILGIPMGERFTGVDLMDKLMLVVGKSRLTVLLIGGRPNLALRLAQCYQNKYPEGKFIGIEGIHNIKKPTKREEDKILSIVRSVKPNLIFVAFGSPAQELWLDRHKSKFKGIVCMGVGQGFDVVGGLVNRAPTWMQRIGLEWLYRLFTQPWRWKRQLRLIEFMWLVIKTRYRIFSTASP